MRGAPADARLVAGGARAREGPRPGRERSAVLPPRRPATPQDFILEMQRTHGNAHVQRFLAEHASVPTIQRQNHDPGGGATTTATPGGPGDTPASAPPPAAAPGAAGADRPTNEFFARDTVEQIRARTTLRYGRLAAYVSRDTQLIDLAKDGMMLASERYRQAYQPYAAAVRAARREAQNQQNWMTMFIGIGIGVGIGVLGELLLPEAATIGAELAMEVGTEAVEGLTGMGAQAVLPQLAGTELEPGGLDPNVLELDSWRTLSRLYHDLVRLVPTGNNLFFLNGAAEYAIGEIRAHVAGGATDMTDEQLLDLVSALVQADQAGRQLDNEISARMGQLESALSQVRRAAASVPDVGEMEKDIWVIWIADIPERDSDILDLDAIEDHLAAIGVLGPGSRLGVDFGWWTSEDDQLDAIRAARREARAVRERYHDVSQLGG